LFIWTDFLSPGATFSPYFWRVVRLPQALRIRRGLPALRVSGLSIIPLFRVVSAHDMSSQPWSGDGSMEPSYALPQPSNVNSSRLICNWLSCQDDQLCPEFLWMFLPPDCPHRSPSNPSSDVRGGAKLLRLSSIFKFKNAAKWFASFPLKFFSCWCLNVAHAGWPALLGATQRYRNSSCLFCVRIEQQSSLFLFSFGVHLPHQPIPNREMARKLSFALLVIFPRFFLVSSGLSTFSFPSQKELLNPQGGCVTGFRHCERRVECPIPFSSLSLATRWTGGTALPPLFFFNRASFFFGFGSLLQKQIFGRIFPVDYGFRFLPSPALWRTTSLCFFLENQVTEIISL